MYFRIAQIPEIPDLTDSDFYGNLTDNVLPHVMASV
jgi:hypothetical protein